MQTKKLLLAGAAVMAISCGSSTAAVAQLDSSLTPLGAIKAGTPDGTIPPYTGGIATMKNLPAGSDQTGWPDPFAGEKPLFTVTAANMAQYAAELTPGEQALLQRYPSFFMNVYPTHRTASFPDWMLQNSIKNATTAQLASDGEGVTGAYGGIPFPVPKNGYEAMWNVSLAHPPAYCTTLFQSYLVDADSNVTFLGDTDVSWVYPYYDSSSNKLPGNFFEYLRVQFHSPPPVDGTTYVFQLPISFDAGDDVTWFYDPATRRVRIAPEFKYDTPVASYGGSIDYDEQELFYGEMNKFDFKLIGRQEMIVPYNDYALDNTSESKLLGPHTLDSTEIRWERHRVWVVEATLKSGERHVYSKWDFYIDEDSWHIMASEAYDHSGAIYRVGFSYPLQDYGDGDAVSFSRTYGFYDLSKGNYMVNGVETKSGHHYHCTTTMPNMSEFSPQAMAAQGLQ
jgi:hypothetical protein